MTIQIDPNSMFSTQQVADMLNVEGLNAGRVRMLCEKGLVPHEKREKKQGGRWAHIRIAFKDFPAVLEAHAKHRRVTSTGARVTPEMHTSLVERVEALEALMNEVLNEVARPAETR